MRHERNLALGTVVAVLGVALLVGCAPRVKAPAGWLPVASDALADPYGGWIRLLLVPEAPGNTAGKKTVDDDGSWEFQAQEWEGGEVNMIQGEFLGFDADSVYVLAGDDSLRVVARDQVVEADVAFFDPLTGGVQGYAAFGGITSLSHGWFAPLSIALWSMAGTGAATTHAQTALTKLDDAQWQELQPYARYPQGAPPALRDLQLHIRPAPNSPPPKNEW